MAIITQPDNICVQLESNPPGEIVVPENIFGTFIKGYKPHVLAKDKVPTVHTTTYLSSFRISLPNGSTNGTLNRWKVFKT